jgi:hypothetical protein
MKNISIYSDIRQYITKTLILPDNLFLLIFSNGLLYSIINLFPHTTFCLVGNITLLLINIYIARFILNKNKRLIPDNNNIQELQNQRDTKILRTDSIEEKIRIDIQYKKRIKKQKCWSSINTYTFLVFIFIISILSFLNITFPSHSLIYIRICNYSIFLYQIYIYVWYSIITYNPI